MKRRRRAERVEGINERIRSHAPAKVGMKPVDKAVPKRPARDRIRGIA